MLGSYKAALFFTLLCVSTFHCKNHIYKPPILTSISSEEINEINLEGKNDD